MPGLEVGNIIRDIGNIVGGGGLTTNQAVYAASIAAGVVPVQPVEPPVVSLVKIAESGFKNLMLMVRSLLQSP